MRAVFLVFHRFSWLPIVVEALRNRKTRPPEARESARIPSELERHPAALALWIVGCGLQDHRIRVGGGLALTGSYLLLMLGHVLSRLF